MEMFRTDQGDTGRLWANSKGHNEVQNLNRLIEIINIYNRKKRSK